LYDYLLVNQNKIIFEDESGNATIEYMLIISAIMLTLFSTVFYGMSAVKGQFVVMNVE